MLSSLHPGARPRPFRILDQNATLVVLASSSSSFVCKSNALQRTTPAAKQPGRLNIQCTAVGERYAESTTTRRSANYQPDLWTHDYIQSVADNLHLETEEKNVRRRDTMKEGIRKLLKEGKDVKDQLQLVDHLQQLGVAYHFKHDIKYALGAIYASLEEVGLLLQDDLHTTALLFRLLRENGFDVSQDMLGRFKDESGGFTSGVDTEQIFGMLSLYEASHLAEEGEEVLSEATDYTRKRLEGLMAGGEGPLEPHLREHVAHALELPLHWRMPREQARWFIEACQRSKSSVVNPRLLEFAKLDFNVVQNIHRKEIAEISRWWTNLGLAEKLPFFRDRIMQNYLWALGCAFEPEHRRFRETQTRANCFVLLIDDLYDVYGTLNELEPFTEAVTRWDINAIDNVPEYMKICFLAFFNTANDVAYRVMKEKGLDIIPHLRRAWADLCKAFLVEATWYHRGHKPTLQEYLDNAWISVSGLISITNAYCTSEYLTEEALQSLSTYPPVAKPSCMLYRLYNDLATSSAEIARGDAPASVQIFMEEKNVSEGMARLHVEELIRRNWRGLNGDRAATSPLEKELKSVAINVARNAQLFYYRLGDGYGDTDGEIKKRIISLLIHPIN